MSKTKVGSKDRNTSSKRVDVVGGFYEDASKNLNAQRSVNLYPVGTIGGKTQIALQPTAGWSVQYDWGNNTYADYLKPPLKFVPSLSKFVCLGWTDGDTSNMSVKLFPTTLASNTSLTSYTYANFGKGMYWGGASRNDICVTDSMVMVVSGDNTKTGANQRTNTIYALDFTNSANITAGTIGWEDNIVPTSICYLKGYAVINHDLTTTGNDPYRGYWWANFVDQRSIGNIAIYNADAATMTYNTGEYVKAVVTNGSYLYLFGQTHYEVWYLNQNTENLFPFSPVQEATGQVGILSAKGVTQYQGKIYLVGYASGGQMGCYIVDGLSNKKISTPQIDRKLQEAGMDDVNSNRFPIAMIREEQGNIFVVFSVLDHATGFRRAYVYNITTGMWHEETTEKTTGLPGETYDVSSISPSYQYQYNFGTYLGNLIKYDMNLPTTNNIPITRYRITQHLSGEDSYLFHERLRLDIEANNTTSFSNTVDANVTLYSSDDDGKTWNSHGVKSFSNAAYGAISGDKRVEWFRLGRSDDRIYKIWSNANTQVYISGAYVDLSKGYR